MRLRRSVLLALVFLVGTGPPALADGRLETIDTPSRFVDAAKASFNLPAGAEAREGRLRANVWLPDGYDGRKRFPVLYLLHGHGDAFDSWVNPPQGDLAKTAKDLKAIIVMPEAARGWYVDWWDGGARGSDGRAWERYHLDELIPLIERRYRISPDRRDHAIAGLSMGGLGALYYAAQRPGYFGSAASFSGAISIQRAEWPAAFDTQGEAHDDVYGDPGANAFFWQGHNPAALLPNLRDTRLFVRVGDGTPDPPGRPSWPTGSARSPRSNCASTPTISCAPRGRPAPTCVTSPSRASTTGPTGATPCAPPFAGDFSPTCRRLRPGGRRARCSRPVGSGTRVSCSRTRRSGSSRSPATATNCGSVAAGRSTWRSRAAVGWTSAPRRR